MIPQIESGPLCSETNTYLSTMVCRGITNELKFLHLLEVQPWLLPNLGFINFLLPAILHLQR